MRVENVFLLLLSQFEKLFVKNIKLLFISSADGNYFSALTEQIPNKLTWVFLPLPRVLQLNIIKNIIYQWYWLITVLSGKTKGSKTI